MSLEKTIKGLKSDISNLENKIETSYLHPEDALREAQEYYRDALIRRADYRIEAEMRILELMPQLSKPLEEYQNSRLRGRMKCHPVANEICELQCRIASYSQYSIAHAYSDLQKKKEIMDNINFLLPDAQARLNAMKENLYNYERLLESKEAKKKPKKDKARTQHNFRVSNCGGHIKINPKDIAEVVNNGAGGISIFNQKDNMVITIKKRMLKDILYDISWFEADITNRGLELHRRDYYHYTFYWQKTASDFYPEAHLNINL